MRNEVYMGELSSLDSRMLKEVSHHTPHSRDECERAWRILGRKYDALLAASGIARARAVGLVAMATELWYNWPTIKLDRTRASAVAEEMAALALSIEQVDQNDIASALRGWARQLSDIDTGEPLPCPFCGSEVELVGRGGKTSTYVKCHRCQASGGYKSSAAAAVRDWNTRAPAGEGAQ